MSNTIDNISSRLLHKAAGIQERIEGLRDELTQLLGGRQIPRPVSVERAPGRRQMSAVGRARISAGQKARWAKARKGAKTERRASPNPPKRGMSAAGRVKIAAAARRRWANAKAAGRNAL